MSHYPLSHLAELTSSKVLGDPTTIVHGVSSVNEVGPDQITLAVDRKNLEQAHQTAAAAIIIGSDLEAEVQDGCGQQQPEGGKQLQK